MVLGYNKEILKKTTEEKILLKNIHAIEESVEYETNYERKKELESQLQSLKDVLSKKDSKDNKTIENQEKSAKNNKNDDSKGIADLYRLLLKRHSEIINNAERKTVGEIKALVNNEDLTVQALASKFKPDNTYKFENHYFQALEKAFNYVRDEIKYVKSDLGIYFWLSAKDIVSEKIGDDEDQAVFLCSVLYALGDENAEVVITELENATSHAIVITEFRDKFIILDPSQNMQFRDFFGEKKEVLERYSFEGNHIKKFLFKFNAKNYEQFQEDE